MLLEFLMIFSQIKLCNSMFAYPWAPVFSPYPVKRLTTIYRVTAMCHALYWTPDRTVNKTGFFFSGMLEPVHKANYVHLSPNSVSGHHAGSLQSGIGSIYTTEIHKWLELGAIFPPHKAVKHLLDHYLFLLLWGIDSSERYR